MDVDTALDLVDRCCYRPGWVIEAVEWHERHEGAILVRVTYDTYDFSQAFAPKYGHGVKLPGIQDIFTMIPAHYATEVEFLKALFDRVQQMETHENREAFRVRQDNGAWWGVFNPHEPQGQQNYGQPSEDVKFGDLGIKYVNEVFDVKLKLSNP